MSSVPKANNYLKYKILASDIANNANIGEFFGVNPKSASQIRKTVLDFAEEKYGWEFTSNTVPMKYMIERFNLDRNEYRQLAIENCEMDEKGNPLKECNYVD